jgi:hypothetical protein
MTEIGKLEKFGQHIGGEFVAGCLIGTLDGKRQYLYRDGVFTPEGLAAYQKWEVEVEPEPEPEPETAITTGQTKGRNKPNKSVGVDHGS